MLTKFILEACEAECLCCELIKNDREPGLDSSMSLLMISFHFAFYNVSPLVDSSYHIYPQEVLTSTFSHSFYSTQIQMNTRLLPPKDLVRMRVPCVLPAPCCTDHCWTHLEELLNHGKEPE